MSELPLYQIVNWNLHFENSYSRKIQNCLYVLNPNKHGGRGWTACVSRPYGMSVYGIWKNIVEVCSRQRLPREGYLTAEGNRDGARIPAAEWARMFRCSRAEICYALQVLASPEVGFIALLEGQPEIANLDGSGEVQIPAEPVFNGTKSPDSGGTKSPDSGGTKSPDSGGTKSPDSGGTKSPDSDREMLVVHKYDTPPRKVSTVSNEVPPIVHLKVDERSRSPIGFLQGGDLPSDVRAAIQALRPIVAAADFHVLVEKMFRDLNFETEREVQVENRGDGRKGFVDLVVRRDGQAIAVELDNASPREKSIFKLQQLDGVRLVLLRQWEIGARIAGTVEPEKEWLNKIFKRTAAWSREELATLSELVPIAPEDREVIEWGYSLERDSEGWTLLDGERITKPRYSLLSLLQNFAGEVDKWKSVRASWTGSIDEIEPIRNWDDDGWTDARKKAAWAIWGEDVNFRTPFEKIPCDLQTRIVTWIEENKEDAA